MSISINSEDKLLNAFIILGKEIDEREFLAKYNSKYNSRHVTSFWGTLGWSDDSKFEFEGNLVLSDKGNDTSIGMTGELVKDLKSFNPQITEEDKLVERFINFDNCDFQNYEDTDFSNEQRKKLRLTLFLAENEGALVYIEHQKKGFFDDKEAEIEFIQPKQTDANFSTKRDRLTYLFDPIIQKKSFWTKLLDFFAFNKQKGIQESSFVLKVLTFKRDEGTATELLEKSLQNINHSLIQEAVNDISYSFIGQKKYALYKFNADKDQWVKKEGNARGGTFEEINDMSTINPNAKTLLLIHGTFSSTLVTFAHLHYKKNGATSFLQKLIQEGVYEQIIAFDHPTISHNAEQNLNYLFEHYFTDFTFGNNAIDVMACSRGCIVAELLSGFSQAQGKLHLNKVILFSAANGVGYFKKLENVPKFFSVWRKTAVGPFAKLILAFAQYSSEFFLQMPGSLQMKPDHPSLTSVLNIQMNDTRTEFILFVSDWKINNARGGLFKRSGAFMMDRSIRFFLGKEHDWVVGCVSQMLHPSNCPHVIKHKIDSMHCKYFDENYTISNPEIHSKILTNLRS